jgi:DNA primase
MTPIDEIKNRLDIVEVVQGYIRLKKAGKDYKALCPFHKEKNPSFFVSPSKQIWHCFSCNFGGDMFTFVMKIEGVEFADALRTLAKKAGVVLKREDPKIRSKRNILYEICEEASNFFQEQLGKSKPAQDYLKNRGLEQKTIKDFRIGFVPASWDVLYNHLSELGFKPDDIEKAGLLVKKEGTTKYYDRFRNRIIFPIFDLNSQIVGFSGRIFEEVPTPTSSRVEDPRPQADLGVGSKYINTPETLIYNKSRDIYGLDKAKLNIRKSQECVLVEGQFDVIMAHQAGSKNTVAISGTALTLDHLRILKRYNENLVFSFDADTGGEAATKRAIASAQQLEFNIKVALLPGPLAGGKDPAEIIKQDSKKWQSILDKAKPIMEFYFESTFAKYPKTLSVDDKREIAKELLYPIKNIANTVEQAHWLQVLAAKLKVEERALTEALRRIKVREAGEEIFSTPVVSQRSRIADLEEHVLGLVLKYSKHQNHLIKNFKENLFTKAELRKVFHNLKSKNKPSSEEKYLINYLIFKAEHCDIEERDVLNEIDSCIRELKANKIKEEMKEISLDIKEAEQKKDEAKLKKLTQKFSKLAEELNKLN